MRCGLQLRRVSLVEQDNLVGIVRDILQPTVWVQECPGHRIGVDGFPMAQSTNFRIELRTMYSFIRECFSKRRETDNLDNSIHKSRDRRLVIRPGFDRFLSGPVSFDQEGYAMVVTELVQPFQQVLMHRFCPVSIHLAGDKQDLL